MALYHFTSRQWKSRILRASEKSTLALKPRVDITRSGPTKETYVLQKFILKKKSAIDVVFGWTCFSYRESESFTYWLSSNAILTKYLCKDITDHHGVKFLIRGDLILSTDLTPVHTERRRHVNANVNVTLTCRTFDLSDGNCDGQNGLLTHFTRQRSGRDGDGRSWTDL